MHIILEIRSLIADVTIPYEGDIQRAKGQLLSKLAGGSVTEVRYKWHETDILALINHTIT